MSEEMTSDDLDDEISPDVLAQVNDLEFADHGVELQRKATLEGKNQHIRGDGGNLLRLRF